MNKIYLFITVLLLTASCSGTKNGKQTGNDSTSVATVDNGKSLETQEADSTFFPKPDPLDEKTYRDHEDMPAYFAFVGRFATYEELRQSPFYDYLCQRIPELAQTKGFTVNTTDKVDDVWMLIPTVKDVWCKIKAFTPDMFVHQERMDKAKVYYASESMKPILIHTSMEGEGCIIVDLSSLSDDKYFGKNAAMCAVPCHTMPEKELKLVPFDHNEDTVYVSIPTGVMYASHGKWWKGVENKLAVKITANGQVSLRGGNGKETKCSYINYDHNKKWMMAVKTDDGKRRAAWEWELFDGEGGPTQLALTQIKGDILPENNKRIFFLDPGQ